MSTFAAAVNMANTPAPQAFTANGMPTNATTGRALIDLFFVLGASRGKDISAQFRAALAEDAVLAVKALFWARDVRGGAGERSTFRKLMAVLEQYDVEITQRVVPLIAEYGRWDDLHVFTTDVVKTLAVRIHADAIRAGKNAQDLLAKLPDMSEEEAEVILNHYKQNHAI